MQLDDNILGQPATNSDSSLPGQQETPSPDTEDAQETTSQQADPPEAEVPSPPTDSPEPIAEVQAEEDEVVEAHDAADEIETTEDEGVAEVVEAQETPEETQPAGEEVVAEAVEAQETPEEAEPTGEEVAAEAVQDGQAAGDAQMMEAWLDAEDTLQTVKRGAILEGTVMRASPSEVLIDVGGKTEGVVVASELDRMDAETLASLEVGGSVMVYVLTPEDRNGNILLSLSRAEQEKDWAEAERYMAEALIYEGSVNGFNKGGLIVRFGGVRGFVPASQVSPDRRRRSVGSTPEERWGGMLHEPIIVKVIEVDRGRNRLILSERAATKENRAARKSALLETLDVGLVTSGRVISLTDFGAFVDIGGADGLVHLSELSWRHVTHPKEVVSVGDEVQVEVISLDRERQRVGLSIKRLQEDPWITLANRYEVGQLVQGTVTKLTKFGAFARLVETPEIEGLIHISELAEHRVEHPRDVVEENQVLTLRIVRINPDKRRVGLSLKRVDSEAYLDRDWQIMSVEPASESPAEVDVIEAPPAEPEADATEEPVADATEEPVADAGEEPVADAGEEPVADAGELAEAATAEPGVAEEPVADVDTDELAEATPDTVEEPVAEAEPEVEPDPPDPEEDTGLAEMPDAETEQENEAD
jgi:small subunit ribosomal protein S1